MSKCSRTFKLYLQNYQQFIMLIIITFSCRFVKVCVTFLLPPAMKGLIVESIEYRSNFQLQKNRHSLKRIFVAKRFLFLLLLLICLHIHLISHMRKQTLTKNDFFFAIKNLFCSLVYTC